VRRRSRPARGGRRWLPQSITDCNVAGGSKTSSAQAVAGRPRLTSINARRCYGASEWHSTLRMNGTSRTPALGQMLCGTPARHSPLKVPSPPDPTQIQMSRRPPMPPSLTQRMATTTSNQCGSSARREPLSRTQPDPKPLLPLAGGSGLSARTPNRKSSVEPSQHPPSVKNENGRASCVRVRVRVRYARIGVRRESRFHLDS
jgi:hypothetical protein